MKKNKVICAMSGGVDSSVAAERLLRDGYEVIGVFMKFWHPLETKGRCQSENACCSEESRVEAAKVARKLGIKLYTFDFEEKFKKKVVDNFIQQYKLGNTPNPCVVCNEEIKFGALFEKGQELGINYIATGHYAKVQELENGKVGLFRSIDKTKDQSYFLYRLPYEMLSHLIFPLGDFTKDQVREMAKKAGLSTASRKESQEVCFVPDNNLADFLRNYLKNEMKPGKIVDLKGDILGEHSGLPAYTIGQRRGIKIGGTGPYYVIRKDIDKNDLIVSNNEDDLLSDSMKVENINWLTTQKRFPLNCQIKIRHFTKPVAANVQEDGMVNFEQPVRAITPGQSAVFYDNDQVLGGGIITFS